MVRPRPAVLLLALVFLLGSPAVQAQFPTSDNLAPEVVLVIKLVSRSDIRPTTGVVISPRGDVLIPSGFTDGTEELVVLDGGADLVRNGRKAILVVDSPAQGLAIVNVNGLGRPSASIGSNALIDGDELTYAAFQPAKELLQGMPPFFGPITIDVNEAVNIRGVSPDTPVPNLAGILLDHCGNLRGLSIPDGEPSLSASPPPIVIFEREITRFLDANGFPLPSEACEQEQDQDEIITKEPAPKPESQVEISPAEPDVTGVSDVITEPVVIEPPEIFVPPPDFQAPAAGTRGKWLIAGLTGLVLLVLAIRFMLARRQRDIETQAQDPKNVETFKLRGASDLEVQVAPDLDSLPTEIDGLLCVQATLPDGTELVRYQPVEIAKLNVVLGNSDAGVRLDHPSVDASHAVIGMHRNRLTLQSLSSTSHTWAGTTPCQKDEVIVISEGEIVVLGEVSCRVSLNRRPAQSS